MKSLSVILEENKREAIEIVKAQGGRIDFVEGKYIHSNNPFDYEEDDFVGNLGDFNCPRVIVGGCDSMYECAVLSVVYDEDKGQLMAWVIDVETEGEILYDWYECSFESYSDDDVYQQIYNLVNGQH
jgi:hypothetical protein